MTFLTMAPYDFLLEANGSHILQPRDAWAQIHTPHKKDIVISCCGVKGLVKGDMVKEGVIIIDVGINVEMVDGKKKIFGDCERESIEKKASMMTPVPGGVGPMTISSLMEQVHKSYMVRKVINKKSRNIHS